MKCPYCGKEGVMLGSQCPHPELDEKKPKEKKAPKKPKEE